MKSVAKISVILISVIFFQAWASASTPASGTVTATRACEAFVSKNKRSNPDGAKLATGQKYSILQVNKVKNPDWFQIRVETAHPQERWVAESCGSADVRIGGGTGTGENGNTGGNRGDCHTPGLQDSFLLALSWQPAFCESHRAKPECRITDTKAYQAQHFTLHGLWPNKASCGTDYGFCGEVRSQPDNFCNYPALSLSDATKADLKEVMPSIGANSCLQRHEWHKHGTCQTIWPLDQYYEVAIDLTRQFNESGIAYFIARNLGSTVTEAALIDKVDCALGTDAHKSIELKCENGNLVDVRISLPKTFNSGTGLGELMRQAQGHFKSTCGGRFKVDPIGFAR